MKKILWMAVVILGINSVKAQDSKFGITAGYSKISQKFEADGLDISVDEPGFFIGIFTDITTSNDLIKVQPSILYSKQTIGSDDFEEDVKSLQIPILIKYYLSENVYAGAGPEINYLLEDSEEDFTNFGLGLVFGAGYDFNENFTANLSYNFQLNNSYTGDGDLDVKLNYFNIGLAYKL